MRFGENFHNYLIPEWEEHYVDYHGLKRLVKSLTDPVGFDPSANPGVLAHLESSISGLLKFFNSDCADLDFPTPFAYVFAFADPDSVTNPLSHLGRRELFALLDICDRKRHDLRQLDWFQKINSEAIDRILAKLGRLVSNTGVQHAAYDRIHLQWGLVRQQIHAHLSKAEAGITAVEAEVQRSPVWTADITPHAFIPFQNPLAALIISAGRAKGTGREMAATKAVLSYLEFDLADDRVSKLCSRCHWGDRWALVSAARYGLRDICEFIVATLTGQQYFNDFSSPKDLTSQRITVFQMVLTSLQVAVSQNQTSTAQYLITVLKSVEFGGRFDWLVSTYGKCLWVAIRNQNDELVRTLLPSTPLLGFTISGRNVLHLAAQHGRVDYVTYLLEMMQLQGLQLDVPDESRGWTPLFLSAYHGHLDVVKLLLGVKFSQGTDLLGWTAKEHAAFRGHLHVAALFPGPESHDSVIAGPAGPPPIILPRPPIQCGDDEYMIIVNLGATQKHRTATTPTSIGHVSSKYNPKLYQGHNIELEVSVPGLGPWDARRVSLPVLDDKIIDPLIFRATESLQPELLFRIVRANADQPDAEVLLGSGTALLSSHVDHFGVNRQSLIREQTVPILSKDTMSKVGAITFTFLIIKPFPHPQHNSFSSSLSLRRESASSPPVLIGHRGLGMNFPPAYQSSNRQLQIGENTVCSFLTAAKLGASFVEFDVQITRDLQPVIYHDFSLSESGTDVPIHDVTLDQYLYASNIQSPHGNPLSTLGHPASANSLHPNGIIRPRPRSRSLGSQFEHGAIQVHDRMKHTVDYKLKGYKPNTRGEGIIQDTFATLKEILTQLPEEIGLDVEVKYPRLHEAKDAGVAPVAIELNTFVDIVLQTLFTYTPVKPGQAPRRIFLSSFTPEVCILLAVKQKTYPVMFITNAGKVPMTDLEVRAASLQVAVKFAKKWNLAGVVFACEALLLCPRLVEYVRGRGLVCASYGVTNNVPEEVEKQVEAGVDIIIADRVGLIAKTLGRGTWIS
ncbi:Glycerophosphoryl diester phosphodiesterase family domain containing protein [Naviculisporaceae sp. PSN 640]